MRSEWMIDLTETKLKVYELNSFYKGIFSDFPTGNVMK